MRPFRLAKPLFRARTGSLAAMAVLADQFLPRNASNPVQFVLNPGYQIEVSSQALITVAPVDSTTVIPPGTIEIPTTVPPVTTTTPTAATPATEPRVPLSVTITEKI